MAAPTTRHSQISISTSAPTLSWTLLTIAAILATLELCINLGAVSLTTFLPFGFVGVALAHWRQAPFNGGESLTPKQEIELYNIQIFSYGAAVMFCFIGILAAAL